MSMPGAIENVEMKGLSHGVNPSRDRCCISQHGQIVIFSNGLGSTGVSWTVTVTKDCSISPLPIAGFASRVSSTPIN